MGMFWHEHKNHNGRRPPRRHCGGRKEDFAQDVLDDAYWYYRDRAERRLQVLNAWAEEMRLLLADCNARYHGAMYARSFGEAMGSFGDLDEKLDAINEDLRASGLETPPRAYRRRGWRMRS